MSDTADDFGFDARELLDRGKTPSLRKQMREYVSEHDADTDLEQLRAAVSEGDSLSDIVSEEREARF